MKRRPTAPRLLLGVALLAALALAAPARAQEPGKTWSLPDLAQSYWIEPDSSLADPQIEALRRELGESVWAVVPPPFGEGKPWRSAELEINHAQAAPGPNLVVRFGKSDPGAKSKPFGLQLNLRDLAGQAISLDLISKPGFEHPWCLSAGPMRYLLSQEAAARKFGDLLASLCRREGIALRTPRLGFTYDKLSPQQSADLGVPVYENVLVYAVSVGGPAELAGLRPRDVVTAFNGAKVTNLSPIPSLLEPVAPGGTVRLDCLERTATLENGQQRFVWKPKVVEIRAR